MHPTAAATSPAITHPIPCAAATPWRLTLIIFLFFCCSFVPLHNSTTLAELQGLVLTTVFNSMTNPSPVFCRVCLLLQLCALSQQYHPC